jgi:hypothetical protein
MKRSFTQSGSSVKVWGQYQNGEEVMVPFMELAAKPGTRKIGFREEEVPRRRRNIGQ